MERDGEQEFVLSTSKWRSKVKNPEQSLFMHQGYITTPHGAKSLRSILCTEDFNALADIGFYNAKTNRLCLNDPALTCRVRTIKPHDKTQKKTAELTVKLYKGNRKDNKRIKLTLNFDAVANLLETVATHQTTFDRHFIEYGNDTAANGKDSSLAWKVDVFRAPLGGLVMAKTERATGIISTVQVFDGHAQNVTDDRNYTGYMLGQFEKLSALRSAEPPKPSPLQAA